MRYLAIGDVHGCYQALTTLAAAVPFKDDDVLVFLGDYVDRGPDSRAVLEWLIDRREKQQVITLRGNHEVMMLDARLGMVEYETWWACGGDATMESYSEGAHVGRFEDIPDHHWQFLVDHCQPTFEIDTHFFVHANAQYDLPLDEQPDYMLYWETFGDQPPHESGKIMVCGHTSQRSGWPEDLGHAVCIDTWVYGNGWLTCLDINSGEIWQARESGQSRRKRFMNR